jgi:hypothetical protein
VDAALYWKTKSELQQAQLLQERASHLRTQAEQLEANAGRITRAAFSAAALLPNINYEFRDDDLAVVPREAPASTP